MIKAQNLFYSYSKTNQYQVNDVSFEVKDGEIFGFLGPNGAGKSTIVKMLTGQLKPKQGSASVLGLDVARKPKQVQAQVGIALRSPTCTRTSARPPT